MSSNLFSKLSSELTGKRLNFMKWYTTALNGVCVDFIRQAFALAEFEWILNLKMNLFLKIHTNSEHFSSIWEPKYSISKGFFRPKINSVHQIIENYYATYAEDVRALVLALSEWHH